MDAFKPSELFNMLLWNLPIKMHLPTCQFTRHAFVAPNSDAIVEVKICDTNVISEDCSGGVKMFLVRGRENSFVLLGTEEIYRMDGVVFFKEVCEMSFECRL